MATRFRKSYSRKMKRSKALKTRKQKGGDTFLERLGLTRKTSPLTSKTNNTSSVNGLPTAGRTMSKNAFIKSRNINQKQKEFAKKIRNHISHIKSINEATRQASFNLMNSNTREKMKSLLEFPNLNSLSDMQLLEFYKTGKIRSQSV
jgi:hypothetical protein